MSIKDLGMERDSSYYLLFAFQNLAHQCAPHEKNKAQLMM